jgi:branched-chain amino acid transport system substrate-binding protein
LGSSNPTNQSLAPVVVGFVNQDAGSAAAYPEGKAAALAAASYINDYLGGVGGHPLKMDTCSTDGTLTSDQNCAQQMVSDKVTYVQSGISFNSYAWDSIFGPAGIPIIGFNPFTGPEYLDKTAFSFSALPVGAAAVAQKIASLPGVKTVSLVVNTVPGSLAVVPLIQAALKSLDVKSKVVKYAEGTANLLATYVSAKTGADAIIANLATPDCIAFAEAAASQSNTLPIGYQGTCTTPAVFSAVGGDMSGWYTSSGLQDPNGSSHDSSIYRAAMAKYQHSAALSLIGQTAFSNVMTAYDSILKPVGASVTRQSALTAITNSAGGQVFMGPAFKCPGAVLPAVCGTSAAILQIKGTSTSYLPGYLDATSTFAAMMKP